MTKVTGFLRKTEEEEPVEEWDSGESEVPLIPIVVPPKPEPWGTWRLSSDWPSVRLRAFNVLSILLLVVNLAALAFFAFAPQTVALIAISYLAPNTLLIIHYRRLLGEKRLHEV